MAGGVAMIFVQDKMKASLNTYLFASLKLNRTRSQKLAKNRGILVILVMFAFLCRSCIFRQISPKILAH